MSTLDGTVQLTESTVMTVAGSAVPAGGTHQATAHGVRAADTDVQHNAER